MRSFFLVESGGWAWGGRLLFEKMKRQPGSQASKGQEALDSPQMEKGCFQQNKPSRLWEGLSVAGLTFSDRWVLAAGPQAFMSIC